MNLPTALAIALTLTATAFSSAEGRPVSYPEAWTLIVESDRHTASVLAHYTTTPKWSFGLRKEWDRDSDANFSAFQATYLAKRWFGEDYQANVYLTGAIGQTAATDDPSATNDAIGFVGVLADWETRRFFTSYQARYVDTANKDAELMQTARIGVAPYIGDTGDLHTWLMLAVDHRPNADNEVGVTPLVRFFKGAALVEVGWSIPDDKPIANFTYRF